MTNGRGTLARRARSSAAALLIAGIVAELALALALRNADPDRFLGVTGVLGIGMPVLIALERRPVGVAVAAIGSVLFVVLVGYAEPPDPFAYGIPLAALWIGLTWITGSFAEAQRRRSRQAIDDARRAGEGSARLHREILRALVPPLAVHADDLRIDVAFSPGEQRLEFGGDFFDAVERDDGTIAILVGDVSGHGTEAAALGATLRAGWRAMVMAGLSPRDRLETLHAIVLRDTPSEEMFVTVCSCVISPARTTATVTSAGHPAPILLGTSVAPLPLEPGPPLGTPVSGHPWQPRTFDLEPGFGLLFYTDGIIEGRAAPGRAERLGLERFMASASAGRRRPDRQLSSLMTMAEVANGGPLADDAALVLVTDLRSLDGRAQVPVAVAAAEARNGDGDGDGRPPPGFRSARGTGRAPTPNAG